MVSHSLTPRVLHCVERMHTNAIETWLARMHRYALDSGLPVDWHYHVQIDEPGALEQRYEELFGRVIRSRHSLSEPWAFFRDFHEVCRQGCFDVVHVHADIMSAPYLVAARLACHAKLIVHVHNTAESVPVGSGLKKAILREPMRRTCLALADKIVGVSNHTLDTFLRGRDQRPSRDQVIHCGIETDRFRRDETKAVELRHSFGFMPNTKILIFVGRMIAYKNPNFVIEVLSLLHQKDARFAAVFAGTGPFEDEVRELARQKGLHERVRVLGWHQDVPELMQACDLLIWPGVEDPKEGLGLGVVEAQAAGLPVLMSRNVPEEAVVVPELVKILPLSEGPQRWAEAVVALLGRARPARHESLARVEASSFSIEQSADNIAALYALPS